MSVYTALTPQELAQYLEQYDLGELLDFQGILDGVENTNYFVNT